MAGSALALALPERGRARACYAGSFPQERGAGLAGAGLAGWSRARPERRPLGGVGLPCWPPLSAREKSHAGPAVFPAGDASPAEAAHRVGAARAAAARGSAAGRGGLRCGAAGASTGRLFHSGPAGAFKAPGSHLSPRAASLRNPPRCPWLSPEQRPRVEGRQPLSWRNSLSVCISLKRNCRS